MRALLTAMPRFRQERVSPVIILAGLVITSTSLAGRTSLPASERAESRTDPISEFTGSRTRVTWVQDTSRAANDVQANGATLLLMGYDSGDGRGARPLLPTPANYARPLLTADGLEVIYTDRHKDRVMRLRWGSSRPTVLARGAALCSWTDPADRSQWVVVGRRVGEAGSYFYRSLARIRVDKPSPSKPIWSKTRVSPDNFQLSRNGLHAAGVFPWPNAGRADLDPQSPQPLTHLGKGCWASLAPDNSLLAWVFDGPHRHLRLRTPDNGPSWSVAVDGVPDLANRPQGPSDRQPLVARRDEMFHPRWTNHTRYLVLTGPYRRKGPINVISGGGPQVEAYLARFSKDYRSIEAALRITRNGRPDFFPDAWIQSGPASQVPRNLLRTASPTARTDKAWPPTIPGLAWAMASPSAPVRLKQAKNGPVTTCQVQWGGRARPGRGRTLRVSRGHAIARPDPVSVIRRWNTHHELTLSMRVELFPTRSRKPQTVVSLASPKPAVDAEHHSLSIFATPIGSGSPGQDRFTMGIEVGQADAETLATMKPGVPTHVILSLSPNGSTLRINNSPPRTLSRSLSAALSQMKLPANGQLTWGNSADGRFPCDARLSHLTLSSSRIDDNTAQELIAAAHLTSRTRPSGPSIIVQARCVETSPAPTPAQVAPYRRALVYHHYRIDRVETGQLKHKDILVGHWAILDGKSQSGRRQAIGRPVRLTIEPFDWHPQLDSERQVMEVERIELPQYIDIQ